MENDQELIKEVYPISILRESQQNKDEGECWISEDVIKKWTDNPQGVSPEYPYEFCCTRHYTYKNIDNPSEGKEWQPWDTKNISLWAHYGMNATPYQLLLGNPYESIYQIEASGATREAYVIIDGDGISTGEMILQGGYENKDQKFNLEINEVSILDPINNIERNFKDSNYQTINLGDNWYCRFEKSDNNGNPVIKIIGIGPNPESSVTPPSTIELAPTDSCFKCNLGGKYQKKIVIQAKNKQKNITAAATWTVTAIRDKNGDGIWRYQIMPNIDRVVRNVYYKRVGEDDKAVTAVKDVWNIGDANSLKFDLEKDTYGKSWKDIDLSKQKCIIRIRRPKGNNEYEVLYNQKATSNPEIIACKNVKDMFNGFLSNKSLLEPHMAQYTVEMLVEDPDYGEGFSVVDKCNLVFEYIVSESGKDGEDGEDGKDGTSSVFNLSNDSGSFAYDYKTGEINLSPNDKTTDIQYIVESNYKCCDSIKVGETIHNDSESGTCGRVKYAVTKNTEDWTLKVTEISKGEYSSVFAIPITGIVAGKEVGTATFKMTGVRDLNEDGVYSYRLVPEYAYSPEQPGDDTLDVTVFRDVLIEGRGYSKEVDVVVQVISKLNKKILSTSTATKVSCGFPVEINTEVSMKVIQSNKGVVVKVYTNDEDYNNRPALSEGSPYHFTGEAEDIPWTAPKGDSGEVNYDKLIESIKTISCSNDNIVVIPGKTYTFKFKNIKEDPISISKFTYSDPNSGPKFSDFFELKGESYFEKLEEGSYKLTARTDITAKPFIGTIAYQATGYTSGEITYTWVGDANSDGVYYDYDIEPSVQVLGYTAGENKELVFNIKEITITCKSVKHEGVLKTQTLGSGYILVGSNKPEVNNVNVGELKNGQVTITLGKPSEKSTGESKKLYYSKTDSFRVYWFTTDNDYATAAAGNKEIPTIEINGTTYYQVDSELINVVPNTAIDATQNLQAYTGSGSFVIDPKELTATFEYKSDAPGYYKIRFNNAQCENTGDIYFTDTANTHKNDNIGIIMGPELMQTSKKSKQPLKLTNIKGPYKLDENNELTDQNVKVAWIKCPSVHVGIYKENTFETLLFEDTVIRTGLDGYYWNVDEYGVVSVQSNGDVMTSINQTANSIVSIASGVSPNLCKGAATKKTSLFDWVKISDGSPVNSYSNQLTITSPNTNCDIGTGLIWNSDSGDYDTSKFKFNEGYYGTYTSNAGTITIKYDGPLLQEEYSAPSGKAIVLSPKYSSKGIKFTVPKTLRGNDCILSFYASSDQKSSSEESTVCVKANGNNKPYQFKTTNSVKRYVLKLNNLQNEAIIIYNNSTSSTLSISSIQFEKGSLVTDWKDYGQDVSSIIQEASRIEARVENIEGKQSQIELTANDILLQVQDVNVKIDNKQIELNGDTKVNGSLTLTDADQGFILNGGSGKTVISPQSIGSFQGFQNIANTISRLYANTSGFCDDKVTHLNTVIFNFTKTFSIGTVPSGKTVTLSNGAISFMKTNSSTVISPSSINVKYKLYQGSELKNTYSSRDTSMTTMGTTTISSTDEVKITIEVKMTCSKNYWTTDSNKPVEKPTVNCNMSVQASVPNDAFTLIGYDGIGLNFGGNGVIYFGQNMCQLQYGSNAVRIDANGIYKYCGSTSSSNKSHIIDGTTYTDTATSSYMQEYAPLNGYKIRRVTSSGNVYADLSDDYILCRHSSGTVNIMLGHPSNFVGKCIRIKGVDQNINVYPGISTSNTTYKIVRSDGSKVNSREQDNNACRSYWSDGTYWYEEYMGW